MPPSPPPSSSSSFCFVNLPCFFCSHFSTFSETRRRTVSVSRAVSLIHSDIDHSGSPISSPTRFCERLQRARMALSVERSAE